MKNNIYTSFINIITIFYFICFISPTRKLNYIISVINLRKYSIGFYNEFPDEIKLFKEYILTAIDGSDFEIPNTKLTRENYNSTKNNTSVARAHISNCFDLLNHYILSTVIDPETSDEREMDREHLKKITEMKLSFY